MTLETVSLSDIGQSLVAIEAEIENNNSSIAYYLAVIEKARLKNKALQQLAKAILVNAVPKTMDY